MRFNRFAQPGVFELLSRDAGKDDAMPPRECQLALVRPAFVYQMRVTLQHVHHLNGAVSGLCQRVDYCFENPVSHDIPGLSGGALDGAEVPVFRLQHQQPMPGVQHHKVRVSLLGANRNVVPKQVVGI